MSLARGVWGSIWGPLISSDAASPQRCVPPGNALGCHTRSLGSFTCWMMQPWYSRSTNAECPEGVHSSQKLYHKIPKLTSAAVLPVCLVRGEQGALVSTRLYEHESLMFSALGMRLEGDTAHCMLLSVEECVTFLELWRDGACASCGRWPKLSCLVGLGGVNKILSAGATIHHCSGGQSETQAQQIYA